MQRSVTKNYEVPAMDADEPEAPRSFCSKYKMRVREALFPVLRSCIIEGPHHGAAIAQHKRPPFL